MVKFSNKGRGKGSKRTTYKQKFKIEKKVKQYRKKLKKQAKKLKNSGIKHKKNPDNNVLPNLFPLKQQMLDQYRNSLPKEPEAPIQALSSAEFGLVTMDNKPVYFLKSKDHLTKKYISDLNATFKKCKIVLEVLDSRNPEICICSDFRALCKKNNVRVITVLNKIDSVADKKLTQVQERLKSKKDHVIRFTHDNKHRKDLIEQIIRSIQLVKDQLGLGENDNVSVFVAGKENTGKHTLIQFLCKYAGKYQDFPSELFELILAPGIKIIDAPYKIEDKTGFPLFTTPSQTRYPDISVPSQQQTIIKHLFFGGLSFYKNSILSRNQILEHYMIQDYISVEDLCKKIGKSLRIFGKGGMIDVAKVRNKVLSEWFQGKLNGYINPMNH